jgi:aerobic-type carbon monoxide dehydrogenase small subunit (CoxS/CutS family)
MMKTNINNKTVLLNKNLLDKSLLLFLREDLNLTSVKNGCGIGVCGSCTVLIENITAKACKRKVKDIVNMKVITVEGLSSSDKSLHPLQQSFIDYGAVQCGFCTPGMILTAHAFLLSHPNPSRLEIRKAISPNLCRCTGYQQIIDAIEAAGEYYLY